MNDWFNAAVSQAVDGYERDWRSGGSGPWYLYYGPGKLAIIADGADARGLTLGDNERVPSNRERAGVVAWVTERARRLPCLPAEGDE